MPVLGLLGTAAQQEMSGGRARAASSVFAASLQRDVGMSGASQEAAASARALVSGVEK